MKSLDTKQFDRITVVVPVFNGEKWIDRCVESLLAQSYPEKEILLIDDGSSDNSARICENYSENYECVRFIKKDKNTGVSDTRNLGIREATGKFIVFVDCDDEVDFEFLRILHEEYSPDSMTMCGICMISSGGNKEEHIAYSETDRISVLPSKDFMLLHDKTINFSSASNKIFRLDIIIDNGILFDRNYSSGEDQLFVLEYLKHTNKIIIVNRPLYFYRMSGADSLHVRVNDKLVDKFDVLFNAYSNTISKIGTKRDHIILCKIIAKLFLSDIRLIMKSNIGFSKQLRLVSRMFKKEAYKKIKPYLYEENEMRWYKAAVRTGSPLCVCLYLKAAYKRAGRKRQ